MQSKLTKLRKGILEVIKDSKKPLSAKAILNLSSFKMDLSTIYRALNFLEEQRYIYSLSFSGVKFYFESKKGNGHFLICSECHKILEFENCVALGLQKKIKEEYGYEIASHILLFKGLCPKCQDYLNRKRESMG
ncbi:MAG: Fur family transcriptional regulator [candidate division WOR-3 bacterium]|nr:Fur family transcriptional regulator [candidate division WOR-3 bacterium]